MHRLGHRLAVAGVDLPAAGNPAERVGGEVGAEKDRGHARHLARGLGVDAADARVGVRRMEEDGVELARPVYVVGIVAAAGDEAIVLLAAYRGAGTVIPGHLPLPWLRGGPSRPPSLTVRPVLRRGRDRE